jgi:TolB-like protein/predicted Zn-dependent protease
MKTANNVCAKCGAKIPDDTTREVCPACLLETGLGLLPDAPVVPQERDSCGPADSTKIPSKFGDFEIARREDGSYWELGHGGMGVTYRARDNVLHRSVALKVIEVPPEAGNSEVVRERFLREARAAAALRHPNVAAVYHFGTVAEPDRCYYAMELVEGETLEARVRREGPLKVAQVLEIGAQVTRALIAAANQGLIHRDLKPVNIMLTRSEDSSAGFEAKVIDFGLAKVTAESFGEMDLTHGGFVGTPSYASPEQFAGGGVDVRSDIYSLGASLWFALTGRLPCAGTNVEEIRRCQTEAPLPVQQLVARKVPAPVIALLRSMLAVDPDERPASARELMEAIEECRLKLTGGDETTRRSFFAELQRRNVYKVAIAYAVVAWLLMQIATQVFPFLEIPNWTIRLVIVLLALGFPIALVLAWAFELTSEGIKRTEDVDLSKSIRRKTGRKLDFVIIAVLSLVIAALLFQRFHPKVSPAVSSSPEKSIAVLPFENLSRDPDNAYFADGIQEEILTRLAKVADLKVISRTSTQRYQSKPGNLAEIAKQLGVANVLEGSVQKAADQVRLNVQLINAQTDSHLWAETYDRKLTDIFGVESEIAKGIAESLQAKLTGREEQALAVKPTNNPEAYDAYLRGLASDARGFLSFHSLWEAIDFYERAVQLDPNFALAWTRLCRAHAALYFTGGDTTLARRDAARRALENAQKLQPNSPETVLASGYYQYWVLRDYGLAKTTFTEARKMLPGSSEVPFALGLVTRREGNWDESIAYFEEALALDPRNTQLLSEAALTYAMLRQFPTALKLYDRALDVIPNDPSLMAVKASIYQTEGNLQEAAKLLVEVKPQTSADVVFRVKFIQLRLERKFGDAIRLAQARQAQFHFASEVDKGINQVILAVVQRLAGDDASAKATAEQAHNTLEPLYKNQQDNAMFAAVLSTSYAVLGNKELALKEAERAVMLMPSAKDRVFGPAFEEWLALVQTMVGENGRAISTLTQLLQTPYNSWIYGTTLTPALLRLDPKWDPLRADPAFQKLCEEKQPVAPESVAQSAPTKSIAVLPFENLSRDPDNAYFADGIQEEILTRLAKIADLKVISRTSTQQYQSKPGNLSEIAKQLDVANILEGSVQKAGDQVRVNVQLVDAQTDSHLWAETYDRKLTDIFGVESDIAKGVAESLQAKLTGHEEQALAVKPTNNTEAYDAYLRGLAFDTRSSFSADALRKAIDSYERAVELDANFALAWARLSRGDANFYFFRYDTTAARRDAAKTALENAQKLQPNSPETQLALGYYQYLVLRDYGLAKTTFKEVSKLLPSSSEVPRALGSIARREGHWDESIAYLERGLALDPRNSELLSDTAFTYMAVRQFPAALKLYDRALDIIPNDPDLMAAKAGIYQAEGNLQEAAKLLLEINAQTPSTNAFITKIIQLRLERNHGEAVQLLQARQTQFRFDSESHKAVNQLILAWTQRLAGDTTSAKATAEQARNMLGQLCKDQPDNSDLAGMLALANAVLGEKNSALKEIQRAIMLLPSAKDRVHGPAREEGLAEIQVTFGENSEAISTLTQLLQTPYISWFYGTPVTPALLRLDPGLDPLRADPAFQKLCEEKQD